MKVIHNQYSQKRILIVEDQFIEAYDLQLILENAGYIICGVAKSFEEALALFEKEKPDLVLLDIFLKGKRTGIDFAKILQKRQAGFIYISANSGRAILDEAKTTQPFGFIVKPFREQDVLTTLEIAFYRLQYSLEAKQMHLKELQEFIDAIPLQDNWENAIMQLAEIIQSHIPFDYMEIGYPEIIPHRLIGVLRKQYKEHQAITPEQLCKLSDIGIADIETMRNTSPPEKANGIIHGEDLLQACRNSSFKRLVVNSFRLQSYMPLAIEIDGRQFNFCLYSRQADTFDASQEWQLIHMEETLSGFVNKHYLGSAATTPNKNADSPVIVAEDKGFEGMIGNSAKMAIVFGYIKKVAPLDISVLILGDSGTGKEKVAQSIHNLSKRKDKPFVIVNCGAIPEHLAESILFGHEKGAFTGATERHIGKFELAEGGTVFLDEIGEMSMELQVKLLRVLQEKEVDRIGGKLPVKADVRIITATNKNLEAEVAAGNFRMDLYYRLHIFPITVPALKERKDDIPALVAFFTSSYVAEFGDEGKEFSKEAVWKMLNYDWPGNIRELEHFVQRTLLLSEEKIIDKIILPTQQSHNLHADRYGFAIKTSGENEREHILFVLDKCGWKISGIGGAAEMLGLNPSTLNSKMRKLEIRKA